MQTLYQHLPVSIGHNGPVELVRHFRPVESSASPDRLYATFRGRNLSGVVESPPEGYTVAAYAYNANSASHADAEPHGYHSPAPAFVRWMWDADPTLRQTATLPRSLDTLPHMFGALAGEVSADQVESVLKHGLPCLTATAVAKPGA